MTTFTTETPLQLTLDQQAPETADEVVSYLDGLELRLLDSLGDLAVMGVDHPVVQKLGEVNGSDIYAVDGSMLPGKAFKYYSAATAVLWTKQDNPEVQRYVTGSAGNYSLALGAAATLLGLGAKAHTPSSLNPTKKAAMKAQSVDIDSNHKNVVDAVAAARREAAEDPEAAFLHPYNHPYGLKGLQLLARRAIYGLEELGVDLRGDTPVEWHWHSGGRSGLAATAVETYKQRWAKCIGRNFTLHEVRPKRLANGAVNPRYDGLAVDVPGTWAAPVVDDKRFVQGYHEVSDIDMAIAANMLRDRDPKGVLRYENSALVGLASVLKHAKESDTPKAYVAVLTGGNVAPGSARFFDQVLNPGKSNAPHPPARKPHRVANPGLSGTTAAFRQGPVTPRNTERLTASPEAQRTFSKQLDEWGVSLVHHR
jgi:threonine dehydratase